MTYEAIGALYYNKNGEDKTVLHYIKPINSKNGEGFQGEKLFLNGIVEIHKGDLFKIIFDLGYNGKPYVAGIEKID